MKSMTDQSAAAVSFAGDGKVNAVADRVAAIAKQLGVEAGEPYKATDGVGTVNVRSVLDWVANLPAAIERIEARIEDAKEKAKIIVPHLETLGRILATLQMLGYLKPAPAEVVESSEPVGMESPPSGDEEPADEEPADEEPTDKEPTDKEPTDKEPTDKEPTDKEPASGDPS